MSQPACARCLIWKAIMKSVLSAKHECISQGGWEDGKFVPSVSGVVLRGMGQAVQLSASEARSLAAQLETKWPELAEQLSDAASDVDSFTQFDGPMGACDEMEAQPGNYEMAEQMIASQEQA